MRFGLAMGVLLILAAPTFAEECYGVSADFAPGAMQLVTVTAKKTAFHDEAFKATSAYVLKGDELLALAPDDDWICTTYIGKNGVDTSGWLKTSDVAAKTAAPLPLADWLGDWTTGKWQNLTLSQGTKPGWIAIEGSAYWAMSEEAALNGGINSGGVGGEAPLENGQVGFTQTQDESYKPYAEASLENYECAILVQLLSRNYLMVEDSGNCGGHNVRFTNIYGRGKVDVFKE